ncbi:hypothetical protein [Pedobacter cryoconitis]|uniref:Uncharacterized protein n=1 Tax=Pedobacter cryoconitis TaxID=188932 RepID=A0A327SIF7_9SPHI|nr:hypothetical protein [Pedobacter cryoconitis]RAJ28906.1 hypothetical protein LY11_03180 [Pedobacter cryoconitis]
MTRNVVTEIDKLKPGDRFYKLANKSKTPFEFIQEESHGKYEVIETTAMKNGFPIQNRIKIFRGNTRVVFLRNVNTAP